MSISGLTEIHQLMKLQPKYFFVLCIWPILLWAEPENNTPDPWSMCIDNNYFTSKYIAPESFPEQKKDETRISAQQVENSSGDITIFTGDLLIERDQLRIRADRASYIRSKQMLDISGSIHIDSNSMTIEGDKGWFDLSNNSGEFENSRYFSPESHLQGSTPKLSISNDKQTILIDSSFSSCPQGDEDWHLNTSYLELDHEDEVGTAMHAVLWFKNIPIFYSPYLSFPLGDRRRSGFLMPGLGDSSSRGTEISIPWYWNIAPNHDAIITPRYMTERGMQLNTDYRYLTRSSNGELEIEYLDKDQRLKDQRYLIQYTNHSDIGENIDVDLLASDASDKDYLTDLGAGINIANTTHLERSATVKYFNGPWELSTLAQTFETIDEDILLDDYPYRRLPQVLLEGEGTLFNTDAEWSLDSEWVEFAHESDAKEKGNRFDIYPRLSWPVSGSAWFVTPSMGLRHSQYDVTDSSNTQLDIDDRNLSVSSIDSGLFFEREINNKYIQTLEPRLFYLHIPFKDQSQTPLFDTSEYDFSFEQLFREERFTGIDRIGDADQFTLALSSRFLGMDTGAEILSMSLGQIFYNEDRKVSLTNTTSTTSKSDIVAEIKGKLGYWSPATTVQVNNDTKKIDIANISLQYQQSGNRIFNIAYRYRRDIELEQTDFSFSWPITNNYSFLSKWNYSVTERRDIETLFGIEYESCCWAMRLVSQRYLKNPDTDDPYSSSIMLQLILKGLGSVVHKDIDDDLNRAILGYQSEY
jgi:LPS-assembly protein